MIKIEHSIFALPFAFSGAFLHARGVPEPATLFWLTAAMVAIRSFAMTINRILDKDLDALNPRTSKRPLVTGEISLREAKIFSAGTAVLFVLSSAMLNATCFALSPIALGLSFGYSYMKRFTWLCHFMLGVVICLAPLAGWLSVSPVFSLEPLLLSAGVLFWLAGFDILYACQDIEFDKKAGLHSVPARFDLPVALALAAFCHVNTIIFFLLAGISLSLSLGWYVCLVVIAAIMWWEHALVSPQDMSRVAWAFRLNGPISVIFFVGVLLAVM